MEHSQSVFLVEGLQPSWLGTRAHRAVCGTMVALSLGLLFGLSDGLIVGLLSGLLGGLGTGSLNNIALVETIRWKWSRFWKRTIPGLICGFAGGLLFGLNNLNREAVLRAVRRVALRAERRVKSRWFSRD